MKLLSEHAQSAEYITTEWMFEMDETDGFGTANKRLGRPLIQITEKERTILTEMRAKLIKKQSEITALKLKKDD